MSPVFSNECKKCVYWGIYKSELVMFHNMRLFDNLDQKVILHAANEGTDSCYFFFKAFMRSFPDIKIF